MWQRFTERARRVILHGQEEAGKLDSAHVGTEHLLIGLARETDGAGAAVLQQLGVSLDQLRAATLTSASVSSAGNSQSGEPKLTPKAKRVLELAANEARHMRHNYIGTEHLLLAFLREKDGLAAVVLRELGLNLANTRAQVIFYLDEKPAPRAATAPDSLEPDAVATASRVSPAIRELLYFAAQDSRESGASQVEIVHLLRAICREESESARILGEASVDVAALEARLSE